MGSEFRCGPRPALAQQCPIEDVHGSAHESYMAWPQPRAKWRLRDCAQT
jgi:hypothetical protein